VRRTLLIVAALLAAVVLFAVQLAPATLADARISAASNGAAHLIDVEGTLWSGRATLAAGATRTPIAWRIDRWPLLRGELHLHLLRGDGASTAMPKGDIAIGRNSVELRDVDAMVPAALVAVIAGSDAALAGGDVSLATAVVEWAPPANRGDARVRWLGASVTVPGSAESTALGDITATLSARGDSLAGPVSNAGGDLAVQGTVTLIARSGAQLSLVLTPRNADDRKLVQALSLIGIPEGSGWRVEWRLPSR
jgi:hypothetical protein